MSNIDKRALRDSAESTISILENIAGFEPSDIDGDSVELRFETEDGFDTGCDFSIVDQCQKAADVIRALLDELEAKEKYAKDRDAENEGLMLTVGRLRAEREAAEKRIAELSGEFFALPPLNDDLIAILGRPNFTCTHLAELLRKNGQNIRRKAEYEQAAVIYWFLDLYLKYGDKWESIAKDDIQARAAMITAAAGKGE
ncbi:TPA: ead/Ea22-like family protein [Enterobacter roggenkampii]|uniref:ead/Ea22-like family protein n=1 Tax=Enterobacter roggenkampii TaxID=1812935 RepID=UPI000B3B3096|nr:ead/Ea22-like family protein [Enterobacter roggenkampii]